MVAAWARAVHDYGRLSLAADLQPAIRLAERGFRVDADFHSLEVIALPSFRAFSSTRALFLTPSGQPLPVGYLLKNPDLARTYRLIGRFGPSAIYAGPIAQALVNAVDRPPRAAQSNVPVLPGIMRLGDLAAYSARSLAPTRVRYRGLDIYSVAPPGGGSTVGEILNVLAGYNLGSEPRPLAVFHYLEASRLAYADRSASVGDPDYVAVPAGLVSPSFAASRRCLIHDRALVSPVAPGNPYPPYGSCPDGVTPSGTASAPHRSPTSSATSKDETNNVVAADRWGDVVSFTNTLNTFGGSGITVPGYGFLLNNEMTCFDPAPSTPGALDPNLAQGGKEPRSAQAPTVVLRHRRPVMVLGAAGAARIITTVVEILVNHIDFGFPLPSAVAAPRVAQTNSPQSLAEPAFYNSPMRAKLTKEFGEGFVKSTKPGERDLSDATAIQVLGSDRFEAVAEPSRFYGGSALVVQGG
jgi:gamma-glutamyltranspeptidase/glutathione hydrolase